MGRRMPVNFQRLRIAIGQQSEIGVVLERPGEVDEIAVGFGHHCGVGQALAD
jgi:hypothetical protein